MSEVREAKASPETLGRSLGITLENYPDGQPDMVATAVARFRRELERRLGDAIESALKAFQNASESSANALTDDELRLAIAYSVAYQAARIAGFKDLGGAQQAYFEVRIA